MVTLRKGHCHCSCWVGGVGNTNGVQYAQHECKSRVHKSQERELIVQESIYLFCSIALVGGGSKPKYTDCK